MNSEGHHIIRLVVEDERSLYTKFNPEPEFNPSVKSYIKSKITEDNYKKGIRMTVISRKPLNEEKFHSAVSNWIKDERTSFRVEEKITLRMLLGLLAFGSIMILLCMYLGKTIAELQYSLLPIMGSLSLSKATGIIVIDIPTIRAKRWILDGIELSNVITFELDSDKKAS